MAEGACLVSIDRERLVEEQNLAEQGQPLRAAGHQGRHRGEGIRLDAIHLLFDFCDLLLQRAFGVVEPRLPCSEAASPTLLRRWSEAKSTAIETPSGHLKAK